MEVIGSPLDTEITPSPGHPIPSIGPESNRRLFSPLPRIKQISEVPTDRCGMERFGLSAGMDPIGVLHGRMTDSLGRLTR